MLSGSPDCVRNSTAVYRVCNSCMAGTVTHMAMQRERSFGASIAAALLVLGACAGNSQAAQHLARMSAATPPLVWRTIPPMHTPRYDAGAAFAGSRIDVVGGFDAH